MYIYILCLIAINLATHGTFHLAFKKLGKLSFIGEFTLEILVSQKMVALKIAVTYDFPSNFGNNSISEDY